MLITILWLFILALGTIALGGIWGDYLDNKVVRFALAPGFLLVLALKHVACLCAGAESKESRPFGPGDEILVHGEPRLPGLGNPIMAALPFVGAVVVLAVVNYFVLGWGIIRYLPEPPLLPDSVGAIGGFFRHLGGYLGDMFEMFAYLFTRAGLRGPLAVYGAICVVFAIRPCYRDVKYLLITVAVLAAIALLVDYLGIGFVRHTEGNRELSWWSKVSVRNMGLLVGTAIALLVLSGLTIGVVRGGGWAKEGREREKARRREEKRG